MNGTSMYVILSVAHLPKFLTCNHGIHQIQLTGSLVLKQISLYISTRYMYLLVLQLLAYIKQVELQVGLLLHDKTMVISTDVRRVQ